MHYLTIDGIIRKLWNADAEAYADHLLRLDPASRRNRFGGAVADPFIGFLSVGGTVLAAIAAELNFVAPGAPAADVLKELGFSGEHFPERTAAVLLQTLGLKRAEAEKIAMRALPLVEAEVDAQ